ncbi:hypothetical protein B0T17DRAFT_508804 [Bombardia bombarda]|uniref:NADH dehydrogenase [ubiquinone] 1 alpha subcomplex subunit n=1 Tax=Bombardia bombarda TaxID=252184 RepID=A0AA40C1E4_9PEZI|nr:hypothetical protein B0T17DRAFT_508804 [Bombardia bombarda]
MSTKHVSPLLRVWTKWKALKLPWRNQFLAGTDLQGNSYWEFKDVRGSNTGRLRRIVRYPPKTHHGDVTVPPAWHQWLRHTRPSPPSIDEQRAELARQERIKILAAQADARWAAKPGLMDAPPKAPSLGKPSITAAETQQEEAIQQQQPKPSDPDPWKQARGGPSEDWTPKAWEPTPAPKKP